MSLKVGVTAKGGEHEKPWVVIEGESVAEVTSALQEVETSGLPTVLGAIDGLIKAQFNAGPIVNTQAPVVTAPQVPSNVVPFAPPQAVPAQPVYAPPAQAAPAPVAPGTPAPQCPHGNRQYKSGTSARGPWAAWMCALPKGAPGACEPAWVTS